jgi:phosphate transport system permease protein
MGLLPRLRSRDDEAFFILHLPTAYLVLLFLAAMLAVLVIYSYPELAREGLRLFTSTAWRAVEDNPSGEHYGLAAAIYGSIYTGVLALLVAAPLSVSLAVATVEFVPRRLRSVVATLSDLMAAAPTIVYGLWGLTYLAPAMARIMGWFHRHLGWLPFFSQPPPETGTMFATAGVLLGIMSTPYAAAVIREAYSMVPQHLREAAYSIGATRFEAVKLLLSTIKPSIVAALSLAFARSIGETVAVALVIGNGMNITPSVTAPGITVASLIALQFPVAGLYRYMESALFAGGLALFAIGVAVNAAAVMFMKKWEEEIGHA